MSGGSGKRKNKEKWVDDGHSIVNMNVEGASWYREAKPSKNTSDDVNERLPKDDGLLQGRDFRKVVLGATLVSVAGAVVFMAVIAVFILFCSKVWFA